MEEPLEDVVMDRLRWFGYLGTMGEERLDYQRCYCLESWKRRDHAMRQRRGGMME